MKNNKPNPLLAWELLWLISPIIITIKNAVAYGNGSVSMGSVLIFAIIMGVVWAIVALIGWFIIKFVFKAVTGGKELDLKKVFIIWLILFLLLFSLSLFKKSSTNNVPTSQNTQGY